MGKGEIQFDWPLKRHNTFRVGGKADAVYFAKTLGNLGRILPFLWNEKIPYMVFGKGSNLIVKDEGFRGVAIVLQGDFRTVNEEGTSPAYLKVGGGLAITELIEHCRRSGLGGLEFLAGIPGTVGGAVAMNAGAFGREIREEVREINVVTHRGETLTMAGSELEFSYRRLSLPRGFIILEAAFELMKFDPEIISKRVARQLKERKEKQPQGHPSGGSIFKNPPNDFAGRLIEESGLKGMTIGGAVVSEKHANWIINRGNARAQDILDLMDVIRKVVREKTGVLLEPEIKVAGE